MRLARAVVIHRLADATAALAPGLPATLLSAPGAGLYAGCLYWRALVEEALQQARAAGQSPTASDILDCGDGSGQALAALRCGLRGLVLLRSAPGWSSIAAIVDAQGG